MLNINVIRACEVEAERQGVGAEGALRLLKAYVKAYEWSRTIATPTRMDLFDMHRIIEPNLQGCLRTAPVTFANGGTAVDPTLVCERYAGLVAALEGIEDAAIEDWLKSFLGVHPYQDGNGRLAWLIRVWLYAQWERPESLPEYFRE